MSIEQTVAALDAKVRKISKRLGYKQIKYSDGVLSGPADCCYIFGIDYIHGVLYYKDEDGQWAEVPLGGGGGGGGSDIHFGIEDSLGIQDRSVDMEHFIFNLTNAEVINFLSNEGTDYSGIYCQGAANATSSLYAGNVDGESNIEVGVDYMTFTTPYGIQELAQGSGFTVLSVDGVFADLYGNIALNTSPPVEITLDITGLTEIDLTGNENAYIVNLVSSNTAETISTIVGIIPHFAVRFQPQPGLIVTFNDTTGGNTTPNTNEILIPTTTYVADGDYTDWFTVEKEQDFVRQIDGMTYELTGGGGGGGGSTLTLTDGNGTTVGADTTSIDLGGVVKASTYLEPDTNQLYDIKFGVSSNFKSFDIRSQNISLLASNDGLKATGFTTLEPASNFLWIDPATDIIHKAAVANIPAITLQSVTNNGNTTTNSITVGASTAPTSKVTVVTNGITGVPSGSTGLNLNNSTASTLSVAQSTPSVRFNGTQFDSFLSSARPTNFNIYSAGIGTGLVSAAGTPLSSLVFESSTSGSSVIPLTLFSSGIVQTWSGISFDKVVGAPRMFSSSTIDYQAISTSGTHHNFTNQIGPTFSGVIMGINSGNNTVSGAKALRVTTNFARSGMTVDATGSVGINTDTPNIMTSLDVNSVGKPMLPPRMTTTQRDGIPKFLATIPVVSGGSGYTISPTINIAGGTGLQAVANANMTGSAGNLSIASITIAYGGTDYAVAPTVSLTTNPSDPNILTLTPAVLGTPTVSVGTIPEASFIYNSTLKKMQFYNGTAWETITSS